MSLPFLGLTGARRAGVRHGVVASGKTNGRTGLATGRCGRSIARAIHHQFTALSCAPVHPVGSAWNTASNMAGVSRLVFVL
jgi:hypothetical protein